MTVQPTGRCVLLFVLGLPMALLPVLVDGRLWPLWLLWLGASVAATGADALLALPRRRLRVEATAPQTLFIGSTDPLVLRLAAPGWLRRVPIEVRLDVDERLEAQPSAEVVLDGGEAALDVPLVPRRRGQALLHRAHLRWMGPLGLVQLVARHELGAAVAVVPNIRAVRAAALRFFSNKDFLAGLKIEQYVGDGSEFDALRDYQPGLDHRAIDWKSSARHRKLLVKDFRAERNHQVVLCFDVGYQMAEVASGIPKLDHAINAALLMGYVALKTGDRVGAFAFDDRVRSSGEPQAGVHSFPALQQWSAGIEYSAAETNYTIGLTELSAKLRRRSLVILFTDFVDTVTAELMLENVARLSRRHIVVFVTLEDRALAVLLRGDPTTLTDLNRAVVAADMRRERDVVLGRLRRLGVFCIEEAPEGLTTSLVNRYLEIKRRELI